MAESAYTSVELPSSVPGIGYTLKHRNAVEKLLEYYCKKCVGKVDGNGEKFTQQDYKIMMNRAKCHDMDKVLLSLNYPQLTADYLHRIFQGHHEESMIEPTQKSKYDWIEMILDMESGKYTKPDKQGGGAFAFASQFKQPIMNYLMPYFMLLGLNKLDTGIVKEIRDEVNKKYYEKDLVDAIIAYIHTTRIHLLDGLARIDDKGYMEMYGKPVPYRHPITQRPDGIYHERPNSMVESSERLQRLEMIHGEYEAQLFDMDRISLMTAEQVKSVNYQALHILGEMGKAGKQR